MHGVIDIHFRMYPTFVNLEDSYLHKSWVLFFVFATACLIPPIYFPSPFSWFSRVFASLSPNTHDHHQQSLPLLRELRLHGTRVFGDVASLKSLIKLTELRLHNTMVQGELWAGLGDLLDLTVRGYVREELDKEYRMYRVRFLFRSEE